MEIQDPNFDHYLKASVGKCVGSDASKHVIIFNCNSIIDYTYIPDAHMRN